MAASPRVLGRMDLKKNRENVMISPERTKVWTEPKGKQEMKKVPVVYYLCRNGQLEHPHFMEVTLSSNDGLYLRDVTSRLNSLRGKGMAAMYSWSSKRSYKNGYVWHDLSENDFIYPIHGQDYVLKGSELLLKLPSTRASPATLPTKECKQQFHDLSGLEASASSSSDRFTDSIFATSRRVLDATEYKVYKSAPLLQAPGKAADASTQTDDRSTRRKDPTVVDVSIELNNEEVSPPPSTSSASSDGKENPDTLETLIKGEGPIRSFRILEEPEISVRMVNNAKVKASAVLMQLISCGSVSVNKPRSYRKPRSVLIGGSEVESECCGTESRRITAIQLEDKQYFSGSLIESKQEMSIEEMPRHRRSNSYSTDRAGVKSELTTEKETQAVRARCIPRKAAVKLARKDGSAGVSRSLHGSKRITDEPTKQAV